MANLWNIRDLPLPVTSTCRIDETNLNLEFYRKTISNAIDTFEKQTQLYAEATLLSRCIYRMKTKFRTDKGVKEMQKINICLRRYLTLDPAKVLQEFLALLPHTKGDESYYPTLGNLDYLLIRLQGTAKLMVRTAECARFSALYMKNRISIGHLWKVACIALGMVARIFVLSKNLIKVCCSVYNNLFNMRAFLKGNSSYEDANSKFPDTLETWLNENWLFEEVVIENVPIDINEKLRRFRSMEDSDVEFSGEYIEIDDDIELIDEYFDITGQPVNNSLNVSCTVDDDEHNVQNVNNESSLVIDSMNSDNTLDEDIGEAIGSDVNENCMKKAKPCKNFNVQIISGEDMKNERKNKPKVFESNYQQEDIGGVVVPRENNLKRKKLKKFKQKDSEAIIGGDVVCRKKIKLGDECRQVEGTTETKKHNTIIADNKTHNKLSNKEKAKHFKTNCAKESNLLGVVENQNKNNSSLTIRNAIGGIKSISELKIFVMKENKMRDANIKKCRLKHLDKMQWNMLNNLLTDLVGKAQKNEAKSQKFLRKGKEALLMSII